MEPLKSATISILNAIIATCDNWGNLENEIKAWARKRAWQKAISHTPDDWVSLCIKRFSSEGSTKPGNVELSFWKHNVEVRAEYNGGLYLDSTFSIPVKPNSEEEKKIFCDYGRDENGYKPMGFVFLRNKEGTKFTLQNRSRLELEANETIDARGFGLAFDVRGFGLALKVKKWQMAITKEKASQKIKDILDGKTFVDDGTFPIIEDMTRLKVAIAGVINTFWNLNFSRRLKTI